MSYSSNLEAMIEVFNNEATAFSALKTAAPAALERASMVLLNTDYIVRDNVGSIDEKIEDITNQEDDYTNNLTQQIEYTQLKQAVVDSAQLKSASETDSEQDITTDLYDDLKLAIENQPKDIEDKKAQLQQLGEELAEVHRKINNYTATADDLQKSADLFNQRAELSNEVYGDKIKEENLKFKQTTKDLNFQIERARQYAKYDKTWAGELERLETIAKYHSQESKRFGKIETEEYTATNIKDLIKQAQKNAFLNYDYESAKKLATAFYKLDSFRNYQIDLTVGTERLTIFGDRSIEDFIDKLKSIGLID